MKTKFTDQLMKKKITDQLMKKKITDHFSENTIFLPFSDQLATIFLNLFFYQLKKHWSK